MAIRISACYITKNEEHTLARSLTSLKGQVDELIVVDTGSTDNTVAVAKEYGAQVYHYEWTHDFAAARNAALDKATGDWVIFLDADEYFALESADKLRQTIASAKGDAITVTLVDIEEDTKREFSRSVVLRLWQNKPTRRYVGKIHEHVRENGAEFNRIECFPELLLYHTGYSEKYMKIKAERNLKLLMSEIDAGRATPLFDRYLAECCYVLEDYQLASATNGKVFRDDLGEFTRIRNGILKYYPEEVRIKKIAREAALMAQSGQYNYNRMFGRGEKVTADIALAEFLKHTMSMIYLLNRRFAPFYKWMHRGLREMKVLTEIRDILTALVELPNGDERIPDMIELIVAMIIKEMKKQGLTSGEDNYLEHHTENILHSIPQKDRKEQKEGSFQMALINEVIGLEWEAAGNPLEGRSVRETESFKVFTMSRQSIYGSWTTEMLKSRIHDLRMMKDKGWNPEITPVKQEIAEEIMKVWMDWLEELAVRYPKSADFLRGAFLLAEIFASPEECLQAELLSYSEETLDLYGRFIAQLCEEGKNLAELTMQNLALLCGSGSLDEFEENL